MANYTLSERMSGLTEGTINMHTGVTSKSARLAARTMLSMSLLAVAAAVAWAAAPPKPKRPKTSGATVVRKAAVKPVLPSRPDKSLTPDQVVRIQMEALQHNDVPKPDNGIAVTFAFASPQNTRVTGPLAHFTEIVKAPAYLPMLNCKKVTYDKIVIEGDTAQQRVRVIGADGTRIHYIFMLSRQKDGPFAGCWMNDGCVRDDSDAESHRFDA
jgi:hypothetical protein